MTIPAIIDADLVEDTTAGTTGQGGPVVSYSAGDRIILLVSSDGSNETITPDDLAGGGSFTPVVHSASQSDAHTLAMWYADAEGAASDDTITYTIGSSEESSAWAAVIDAGTFDPAVAPSATVVGITGNTNDPDPPSHTPAWDGSDIDTLWGVAVGWDADASGTTWSWTGGASAFPDGRLATSPASDGSGGLAVAYATTDPDVDALNPAEFTNAMSSSEEWAALTWAVKGAEAAVPVMHVSWAVLEVPDAATGADVAVPLAQTIVDVFAPVIATGASVAVGLAMTVMQAFTPTVASGATIEPPQATTEVVAFAPSAGAGVAVSVPLAQTEVVGFSPAVASGAAVQPPVADTDFVAFAPNVFAASAVMSVSWAVLEVPSVQGLVEPPVAQTEVAAFAPNVDTGTIVDPPLAQTEVVAFSPTVEASAIEDPGVVTRLGLMGVGVRAYDEFQAVSPAVEIAVDLASTEVAAFAPVLASGVAVAPPAGETEVVAFAPSAGAGAVVEVDLASTEVAGFSPEVASGSSVQVDVSQTEVVALSPVVVSGVAIAPPTAQTEVVAFELFVGAGAVIEVDLAEIEVVAFAPTVSTGSILQIDAALTEVIAFAPVIANAVTVESAAAETEVVAFAPSVGSGVLVDVDLASAEVDGFAPTVASGGSVQAVAAQTQVIGFAPELINGATVLPNCAETEFRSFDPPLTGPARDHRGRIVSRNANVTGVEKSDGKANRIEKVTSKVTRIISGDS